ncbi:hypothetical protein [Ignatzschineria indica]|nr:hypothetical protein [Ignatzschineria indica]
MILKRTHGATGTDYIALFAGVCPPVGIFDALCRHAVFGRMR